MKKFMFLCLLFFAHVVWAKHVPQSSAQQTAVTFYQLNNPSGLMVPQIKSVLVKSRDNVPTFYIFRFVSGGFVLVAADDASIPILGYSFENDMPDTVDNPAMANWLDNYSREIAYISCNNLDNTETIKEWNSIQQGYPLAPLTDVGPLLTTLWNQGCNYNTSCPPDAKGTCGHVYTGCVATAISQILKYHNFPPQGVGENSYIDGNYGQLSADFGNTTYDWAAMPNSAVSNSTAIQTLMYHAGISMDMGYGYKASGAQSDYVLTAFINYFNYDPGIEVRYKDNYANVEDFKALLRADLDVNLPIHYAGYGPYGGHDFVCDGYRQSDGKFHFNWGWGGAANGYYTVGDLNPSGSTYNSGDIVTLHIRPYNSNLVVRILNPSDKNVFSAGSSIEIKAKVVRGNANVMKIIIDNVEKFSAAGDSILYTWNTTTDELGSHVVKAYAMNSTDTVYFKIGINLVNSNEWESQSSGFPATRGINYISAVDSNIVWAIASNAGNPLWESCSDFTRTTNGGNNWTPGVITNTAGLIPSMIFGLDSLKAYAAMCKISGDKLAGIYMTADGGATWIRQSEAFTNGLSYPVVVHFFNSNDGVGIGNPLNPKFEIYTTTNGGTNWTKVPIINIPTPLMYETGLSGCYSAVNDTIWFGTNYGRVVKSTDKGLHWTVSAPAIMSGKYVKPFFRDGSHGLLLDELSGAGLLCETSDGGATWSQVNYTGPKYCGDIAYIPGTPNTWVKSGYMTGDLGCALSFDGGHTWEEFSGTNGSRLSQMAWVNSHCGWAGGVNTSATEGGVYKFIGQLAFRPSPENVQATADNNSVDLTWEEPAYDPVQMSLLGYNIMRDGIKINASLVNGLAYTDQNATTGVVTYCVSALYDIGESEGSCKSVEVAVGIMHPGDQHPLLIYPNPAHGSITITSSGLKGEIMLYDQMGHFIPMGVRDLSTDLTSIDISNLSAGIYLVTLKSAKGIKRAKLVVY